MKVGGRETIAHAPLKVFRALRDSQPELVRYLPNVENIEVLEREDEPPLTRLYNRWQGSSSEVSKLLRPFISPEMLCWFDRAAWDEERLSCQWQLESAKAKGIFECSGTTTLSADGEQQTLFVLEANLEVHPEKIPGVPGFLARKLRDPMEKFVANLLRPNLTKSATAVGAYLDAQQSA